MTSLTKDRNRVKDLLKETITLLCKNGLQFKSEFTIEAVIGITLDRGDDVFIVSIQETVKRDETESPHCDRTVIGDLAVTDGIGGGRTTRGNKESGYRACAEAALSSSEFQKRGVTSIRKRESHSNYRSISEFEKKIKTDQNGDLFNDQNQDGCNYDKRSIPVSPTCDALDRRIDSPADIDDTTAGNRNARGVEYIGLQTFACVEDEEAREGEEGNGMNDGGWSRNDGGRGRSDGGSNDVIDIKEELILSDNDDDREEKWRGETAEEDKSTLSSYPRIPQEWKYLAEERKRRNRNYSASYRRNSKLRHVINTSRSTLNNLSHDTSMSSLSMAAGSSAAAPDGLYVCNECNKIMRTHQSLNQHKKIIHRGLYPYVCEHCHKGFSVLSNLRAHIAGVHEQRKEFVCSQCGKEYGHKHSLKDHLLTSHNILMD